MGLKDVLQKARQKSPVENSSLKRNTFVPILLELLKDNQECIDISDFGIRASMIGNCEREILIRMFDKRIAPEFDARTSLVLKTGTAVHGILQDAISKGNFGISSEEELLWPKYNLTGHYDYLMDINGEKILLEIKTCSIDSFATLTYTRKPYLKHIWQAHIYMYLLGVKKAIILYVNRNYEIPYEYKNKFKDRDYEIEDPTFIEYHINWSDDIFKQVTDKLDRLKKNFNDKTLPPYEKVSFCSYCGVKEICKQKRKEEKKITKNLTS